MQAIFYRHAYCQKDIIKLWLHATINFWKPFWFLNEMHHVFTHPNEGRCSSQLSGLDEFIEMHPVHQYPPNLLSLVVVFCFFLFVLMHICFHVFMIMRSSFSTIKTAENHTLINEQYSSAALLLNNNLLIRAKERHGRHWSVYVMTVEEKITIVEVPIIRMKKWSIYS